MVFFGHYVAGLSGQEPVLVFALGVLLLATEVLFFPGIFIAGLTGVLLILGSLVWSMADLWPNEPVSFNGEVFAGPLTNLSLGLVSSVVLALMLMRFLPRGWVWDRMILSAAVTGSAGERTFVGSATAPGLIGKRGVAVTPLYPSGQIEIDGRRYEARIEFGSAEPGTAVMVTDQTDFGLQVTKEVE